MKNTQILPPLLLLLLLLTACSKEQLSVDKLEGDWRLQSRKVYLDDEDQQDTSIDGKTITYTFETCDLKAVEYCGGNIRSIENGDTTNAPMIYKFSDDANTLIIDFDADPTTTGDRISAIVKKLTKTEFVFEYEVTVVQTQRTVFTLQKI